MPLTEKGREILGSMKKEYGKEKGEEVFYASKNAGTISGVDNVLNWGGGERFMSPSGPKDSPVSPEIKKATGVDAAAFGTSAAQYLGQMVTPVMGRTVPMTKSNSDPVATVDEELMPSPEPMATDSSWNSKPNRPPNDKYVLQSGNTWDK